MHPAAGAVDGVLPARPLEGADGGLGDQVRGAAGGGLDQVEHGRVAGLGEVVEGGAAGAVGAAAGGLQDEVPVVGSRDRGEAAGGGRVQQRTALLQALLGPVEDGWDAPAGARAGGPHLALPAVEGALLARGAHPGADGFARVVGPQPPRPGLVGVAHGGGQRGVALGGGGEARQDGVGEAAQRGVVVAQGELVEGPGPVGSGFDVAAQQEERVEPAVRGEVAEDGEGEPGARLLGVDVVVGSEEVLLDRLQTAVQVEVEAGVVEGAVLDLPVAAGVVEDAVVEGREGFGARGGERVQRAVAAPPLE